MISKAAGNYFELFDIPVAYTVDLNKIRLLHRELQKAVHPDRFAHASAQEKRISMQQTSLINQAFHTLCHPIERAMYLLGLRGVDFNMDNQTTMDTEFLMQQMELREALAEAGDKADPLAELERLEAEIMDDMKMLQNRFAQDVEKDDLADAKELVRKMQFLYKAGQEVEEMTATIEDEIL
jgi:molecular chaperone HscB